MSIHNLAKKRATGIAFKLSLPSEPEEEEKRPNSVEKGLELVEKFESNEFYKPLGIYNKEKLIKKIESTHDVIHTPKKITKQSTDKIESIVSPKQEPVIKEDVKE